MTRAYLDYNATTPVDPKVLEAMQPYFSERFGNASSIHSAGQEARAAVERSRESVAALIGAKPSEIVFTSGGTEADNLAVLGGVAAFRREKKHVICSAIEHPAVLEACQELEHRDASVTRLPVGRDGIVDPEDVRRALRPDTVLITVMFANNELGTIQPLEEIGRIAFEANVTFHTDAVQAAGKLPLNVESLRADLLSLTAHKLCGPKGAGALYVRTGTPLEPISFGGRHERDRRPGTENVPGIIGFGKAAELAQSGLPMEEGRLTALRKRFEQGVLSCVPEARVNGHREKRVSNTTSITIAGAEGEALVIALDLQGVSCATGAACSSGAVAPSHVLTAIGLSREDAKSSLRFSLGRFTTVAEIDFALEIFPKAVARLRELSPRCGKTVAAP